MNTDWQPIETAPKDGSKILLVDGYDFMVVGWWGQSSVGYHQKEWVYGECEGEYNSRNIFDCPTHWMPLPNPPEPA